MPDISTIKTPEEVAKQKRRTTLLLVLITLFALFGFLAFWFFGPNPKIIVSKQTTHIITPLAADGYPDYHAVLLADMKKGVTPENNGAIPFLRVTWPEYDDHFTKEDEKKLCLELGISEPPPQESRFLPIHSPEMYRHAHKFMVSLLKFPSPEFRDDLLKYLSETESKNYFIRLEEIDFDALYRKHQLEIPDESSEYHHSNYRILFVTEDEISNSGFSWNFLNAYDFYSIQQPWKYEDIPFLADWINRNQEPLDSVLKAVAMEGWYYPPTEFLRETRGNNLYDFDNIESIVSALVMRAYLKLAKQEYQATFSHVRALLQLSNHLGKVNYSKCQSRSLNIRQKVSLLIHHLIDSAELPKNMLNELSLILDAYPPVKRTLSVWDTEKRYGMISPFLNEESRQFVKENFHETQHLILGFIHNTSTDWNVVLREQNDYFDQIVSAAKLTTWTQQEAAFDKITYPGLFNREPWDDRDLFYFSHLLTRKGRGKIYSAILGGQDGGWLSVKDYFTRHYYEIISYDTLRMHLAIRLYQREKGELPTVLDLLVPKYLKTLPSEPFYNSSYKLKILDDESFLIYSFGENGKDDNISCSMRHWNCSTTNERCINGYLFDDLDYDNLSDQDQSALDSIPESADDVVIRLPIRVHVLR